MGKFKRILLNSLFPNYCIICGREGKIICDDCFSLIDLNHYFFCHVCGKRLVNFKICENCKRKTNLDGLFFATYYQDKIVKEIIGKFKYPPFLRELSDPLAKLIISHLSLLEYQFPKNSLFIPIPLSNQRKRWRGFNQTEEIGKKLSAYYNIPLFDALLRVKDSIPQSELKAKERKENIKNSFLLKDGLRERIKEKNIFLIDDVYTTGSTLEEAASKIKEVKIKNIYGIVVARE